MSVRMRAGLGGVLITLALGAAAPAVMAQDVDRIDRVAGGPRAGMRPPEGVKIVSPGALVFASFDSDFDGKITVAEIQAGASAAFAAADRNKDGMITGFEQTDWATRMGEPAGVLANAMTFDLNLDRGVTQEEFTSGLLRLARQIRPDGDLTFASLVQPLNRNLDQADGPPAPPIGMGRRDSGPPDSGDRPPRGGGVGGGL